MEPCAFNAMMEQYEKLVYTVCLRFVHDEHLAQDLTQETFLSAWVHRSACLHGKPCGAGRAAHCLARRAGEDTRFARAVPDRQRIVFSAGLPGG